MEPATPEDSGTRTDLDIFLDSVAKDNTTLTDAELMEQQRTRDFEDLRQQLTVEREANSTLQREYKAQQDRTQAARRITMAKKPETKDDNT